MANPITIQLNGCVAERLEQLALALNRSEDWLVNQAIRWYIEEQSWQISAIDAALRAHRIETMELIPHETVMGRLEAKFQ